MTPTEALAQLKAARDGFWFSLGAYALLTKDPAMSELGKYDVMVYENGDIVVSEGEPCEHRGTGYLIGFNSGLSEASARGVVEGSFRKMIADSSQVIHAYAKDNGVDVSTVPAVQFIRHYRNAIAHNGRWDFRSQKVLPLTWRNRTLTFDMDGKPIDGFLTWFEGLQLCAQLNIFITEHTR